LEDLFQKIEMENSYLVQKEPVYMNTPLSITRGIGGVRPGQNQTIDFQDGSQAQYSSTLLTSVKADFVMTRWFYHQ
jgi:hypothetical protein